MRYATNLCSKLFNRVNPSPAPSYGAINEEKAEVQMAGSAANSAPKTDIEKLQDIKHLLVESKNCNVNTNCLRGYFKILFFLAASAGAAAALTLRMVADSSSANYDSSEWDHNIQPSGVSCLEETNHTLDLTPNTDCPGGGGGDGPSYPGRCSEYPPPCDSYCESYCDASQYLWGNGWLVAGFCAMNLAAIYAAVSNRNSIHYILNKDQLQFLKSHNISTSICCPDNKLDIAAEIDEKIEKLEAATKTPSIQP
jgi:hypothetical protein